MEQGHFQFDNLSCFPCYNEKVMDTWNKYFFSTISSLFSINMPIFFSFFLWYFQSGNICRAFLIRLDNIFHLSSIISVWNFESKLLEFFPIQLKIMKCICQTCKIILRQNNSQEILKFNILFSIYDFFEKFWKFGKIFQVEVFFSQRFSHGNSRLLNSERLRSCR